MKRLLLLFVPLVFFFGCEEDNIMSPDSTQQATLGGIAVKWFGCEGCVGGFGGADNFVLYTEEIPYFSLMGGDEWETTLDCEEIVLFQNEGHVNWRTSSDPNVWISMTINVELSGITGAGSVPIYFWEEL